jgi:hypothetical protein
LVLLVLLVLFWGGPFRGAVGQCPRAAEDVTMNKQHLIESNCKFAEAVALRLCGNLLVRQLGLAEAESVARFALCEAAESFDLSRAGKNPSPEDIQGAFRKHAKAQIRGQVRDAAREWCGLGPRGRLGGLTRIPLVGEAICPRMARKAIKAWLAAKRALEVHKSLEELPQAYREFLYDDFFMNVDQDPAWLVHEYRRSLSTIRGLRLRALKALRTVMGVSSTRLKITPNSRTFAVQGRQRAG